MTTLRLTVTETPQGSTLRGQHFDVTETGAALGRAAANSCVLQDNERLVSSRHASIRHHLGQFIITDHSTNGTFINDSPTPLGPDNSTALNEGDTIIMGQYRFRVSLVQGPAAAPQSAGSDSFLDELSSPPPAEPQPASPDPAPPRDSASPALDDLDKWLEPQIPGRSQEPEWGASNIIHSDIPAEDEQSDPLAAFDQAPQHDSPFPPSPSNRDDAPAINQSFTPPRPIATDPPPAPPAEPEPFQATSTPVPDPIAPEPPPVRPETPAPGPVATPTPPPQPGAPAPAAATGDARQQTAALLAQLLELGHLEPQQLEGLTDDVVGVLRETITRLLEMLRARSSIKNELGLEHTMIQREENNPLKFAVTEKDALRYLFGERTGAYMAPSKAVIEAFEDIESHQLALLTGMRQAYEHMLSKFSPEALEKRLGGNAPKGLLGNRKSRLWEAYQEHFGRLLDDPETSFNRLFGDEFTDAYEKQINNIKAAKRNRTNDR